MVEEKIEDTLFSSIFRKQSILTVFIFDHFDRDMAILQKDRHIPKTLDTPYFNIVQGVTIIQN